MDFDRMDEIVHNALDRGIARGKKLSQAHDWVFEFLTSAEQSEIAAIGSGEVVEDVFQIVENLQDLEGL